MATIREIEELIVARLVALTSTTAYKQGSTAATWHESTVPLTAEFDAQGCGHLGFYVAADDAPVTGSNRDAGTDFAKLRVPVQVVFTYQLRPSEQRGDARLASDAARDAVKAIVAVWNDGDIQLANAGRRTLSEDGEWMLVELDFVAIIELSI